MFLPTIGFTEEGTFVERDVASMSDDERAEQAVALYRAAQVHYQEGRFAEAIDLLLEAIELQDAAALHYNLGRSYQELGRWAEASAAYRAYLEGDPESPRRAQVEARIEQLDRRATQDSAEGTAGVGGDEDGTGLSTGDTSSDRRRVSPWPWAIVGTGAVSLVVGVVFAGLFNAQMELAEDPSTDNLSALEAYELAGSYGTAANTTLALGGVMTMAGLIWGIIDLIRSRRARSQNDRISTGSTYDATQHISIFSR